MQSDRQWKGAWICAPETIKNAPYFRKTFSLDALPQKAVIHLSGLGYHELYVNGKKADDRVLAPGPSQCDTRILYVDYDITHLLHEGKNAIAILLGNGYYNDLSFFQKAPWARSPRMLCDLDADGSCILWSSADWKCAASPLIWNQIRCGEEYDARLEIPGFAEPDFDDSGWVNAKRQYIPTARLTRFTANPCRVIEVLKPVSSHHISMRDSWYFDFGVNISGWARIRIKGKAGITVKIIYSEELNPLTKDLDRSSFSNASRAGSTPFHESHYTLKGSDEPEVWEERFCYHGFRYVQIAMPTRNITPDILEVEACFVHTDFNSIGSFSCSDPMLNKLQEITRRSYLGNFVGLPTDCPSREQNGWTGDSSLACETGLWNFNTAKDYYAFIECVLDTQTKSGAISCLAPGWFYEWAPGPVWNSAVFEIPYRVWQFTGNDSMIRDFYDKIKLVHEYSMDMADDYLTDYGLTEWLHQDNNRPEAAPPRLISSAYFYFETQLMIKFAELLGKADDAAFFKDYAEKIRLNYQKKFYHPEDFSYGNCEWNGLAITLYMGLAVPETAQKTAALLDRLAREFDCKADFGIIGAKFVPRALAEYGYAETAFRMITQTEMPGWGWWVKQGATTLWETWAGFESHNHIMFGDISAWMFRYAAGIVPDQPGFRKFIFKPEFISALDHAEADHQTPFGNIHAEWKRNGKSIICKLVIPDGCKADVLLPGISKKDVMGIFSATVDA